MLNKYARAFFTRVLTPFAAMLLRLGVSPDAVTLVGTGGVMAGALVFYPMGEFFWGTLVITLFVFSDLVDGNMARQLGRSSRWGAFLDSTLDRVADAAVFGGIALWYAGRGDDLVLCAVTLFCLASGQVVSYTKARGESIGLPVNVNGLVERAERLVITLVLAGFSGFERTFGVPWIGVLLPVALWVVAAGSAVTLGQRVVTVRREAAEAETQAGANGGNGGNGANGANGSATGGGSAAGDNSSNGSAGNHGTDHGSRRGKEHAEEQGRTV
ncbi:phosphatidylinositol phosphate synthase [Streptomyces cacaoi]|uniref:phosphatidylinositol phosphate synthase n=1 Tax=Streptomyces cacaoi TaxID=1898 RepID=UPI0037479D9B